MRLGVLGLRNPTMPWRDAKTISFSRIDIVAYVPSDPGIYAISDGKRQLLLGYAWNLKARLLELANAIESGDSVSITFELCPENRMADRAEELREELQPPLEPRATADQGRQLPGISFWTDTPGSSA